jgi:hypothetical protein
MTRWELPRLSLAIDTFSNTGGGNTLFKALGHVLVPPLVEGLLNQLAGARVAVYDPQGMFGAFAALHDVSRLAVRAVYVQNLADLKGDVLGHAPRPVSALAQDPAPDCLLVAGFDSERLQQQIAHLVPAGTRVVSFDALRLPPEMLTNTRRYLDPLNFATNFGFLRDAGGLHTRLTLCNYWSGYGAAAPRLWCRLLDADGTELATWEEVPPAAGATVVIDSAAVRERFGLGEFTGSLFIHALGVAGHDIVKYALDTYGDGGEELSATHDANAWPADYYAGLPAPADGETVWLWVQNSHPVTIPAGAIGFNVMGESEMRGFERSIPPFGTVAVDVGALFPDLRWPAQLEVTAGKYFVRPRYEVFSRHTARRRMGHANVERTDLVPDPALPGLGQWLGKGYVLPAPVLPAGRWSTEVLPTPMARGQAELPLALLCYDADGREVLRHRMGRVPREGCTAVSMDTLLTRARAELTGGWGHLELVYDFSDGGEADGWLHALFRYRQRANGHVAESSFGAHVYNVPVTYRGEPQSYTGTAPGLSTRLFLRLSSLSGTDTLCHLIYPSSAPWRPRSDTTLTLHDAHGRQVTSRAVSIPCSGSLLWRSSEMFDPAERAEAGAGAYVMIRDLTCRLFGYHGVERGEQAFSLDHMFGF